MYYPDLSPYERSNFPEEPDTLNVGWLDSQHAFPTGSVSEHALAKILTLCAQPINQTRGLYVCGICSEFRWGVQVQAGNNTIILGSAEIRVSGRSGTVYAAPTLIYHYMKEHHYCPPAEFLKALEEMEVNQSP